MAQLTLTDDTLQLRFTTAEKVLGLVRDHDFPRSAITSARVEQDGLGAVRGVRAPGLGLPAVRKIGTWRGKGRTPPGRLGLCSAKGCYQAKHHVPRVLSGCYLRFLLTTAAISSAAWMILEFIS